jgi:hypothetical protein
MNVYNLSNMSKRDAEALILSAEGRVCVRYYHRSDGTILTGNCPVGLQALKRRVSGISRAAVSSVLSFFAGIGVLAGLQQAQNSLRAPSEVGVDLIHPVPLVEEEAAPPPDEGIAVAMGAMAFVDKIPPRTAAGVENGAQADENLESPSDSFTMSGEF